DNNMDASIKDGNTTSMLKKRVDHNFWKIFDFKFIAGKPFDKATVDAQLKEVILQKSSALKLFGTTDITGKEIKLNHYPYIVRGVVEDTSPLLSESFANLYIPYAPEGEEQGWMDGYGGDTKVLMLRSPDTKYEDIKSQVKSRYSTLDAVLKKTGGTVIYHQAPYTSEEIKAEMGSNSDPHQEHSRRLRYVSYFLLLILPAINLSNMTRSRLRQRVSEIGVRRAYGATKWGILNRFLGENLILTLAGGLIGFILCLIFVAFFSNLFISYGGLFGGNDIMSARPTFSMLLNYKSFGLALLFCLILNILSTGFPAWRASRLNPAEAISGKKD
ncbi:MAG: ABC transporter permease, partial [Muribaculaceae bacterium]|nr:ABC transporter permease [Muribaculaceae bacterium]